MADNQVHMGAFVQRVEHLMPFSLFPWRLQRRALRTASEKLRNRSSFSTNVVYTTPGTRVNRYISRLLEARQTELEMADLNFFTLKYKHAEREQKVSDWRFCPSMSLRSLCLPAGLITLLLSLPPSLTHAPSPISLPLPHSTTSFRMSTSPAPSSSPSSWPPYLGLSTF